jgi:outer membrane protein assembly factor BamA
VTIKLLIRRGVWIPFGNRLAWLAPLVAFAAVDSGAQTAPPTETNPVPPAPATGSTNGTNAAGGSKLVDPLDGWFDASGFLDTAYGFMPIATPITEPAVGYGAVGGLMFIERRETNADGTMQKPNLTMLGGGGTENGTWAVLGGSTHSWFNDKLETIAVVAGGSINLKFYGIGNGPLRDTPVDYNIKPVGTILEGRYRIGDSRFQAGLRYNFADTRVTFDSPGLPPQITSRESDAKLSGLTPTLIYDTRDNLFTPTRGLYAEAGVAVNNEAWGSDFNYEIPSLALIFYQPLAPNLFLGVNANTKLSFGDPPFYALPYVSLRGVPYGEYVGGYLAEAEVEARWQFWKRFSLVGFAGAGMVWNNFNHIQSQEGVVSGGTGFRYELARKYGLHMGMDVAFGPNGPAFYVQVGSAWFRP